MAARFKTATFTSTGAEATLHDIINSDNDRYASTILIRAGGDNTAEVTWKDALGSTGGHLNPDDAVTIDLAWKYIDIDKVVVVATTSDEVEVTVAG